MTTDQHGTTGRFSAFLKGAITVMPLSIAVIPWGVLAGSYALDTRLSPLESQAMSAIVFAGSAQLVALGMVKAGTGLGSILLTTLLVTSRHFLYGMSMRPQISPQPLRWRLALGFLLTDELFAIASPEQRIPVTPWYALGGGLTFYLNWNLSTCAGIVAGRNIPNLAGLGLDFAIAATFIALVVPTVKKASTLICVLTSLLTAVVCALFSIDAGLLIAALLGMTAGMLSAKLLGEQSCTG